MRTQQRYPYDRILSHKFPLPEINEAFREQEDGHITRGAIVPRSPPLHRRRGGCGGRGLLDPDLQRVDDAFDPPHAPGERLRARFLLGRRDGAAQVGVSSAGAMHITCRRLTVTSEMAFGVFIGRWWGQFTSRSAPTEMMIRATLIFRRTNPPGGPARDDSEPAARLSLTNACVSVSAGATGQPLRLGPSPRESPTGPLGP
jgi:hypothetical protein